MNGLSTLFAERFFARTDCVAVLAPWGKPCPVDAVGKFEQLIDGHLRGKNVRPFSVYRLDADHEKEHLHGQFRIGSYVPDTDGNTPWLCMDIDGPPHDNAVADPNAVALRLIAIFEGYGITVYVEVSGGGTGWHLWVFCDPKVRAAKVRQLAFALIPGDIPLANAGFAQPRSGVGVEVFPKTDRIAEDGVGNMVWLPCWQDAKPGANQFCSLDENGAPTSYTPEIFETITETCIDAILAKLPTVSQESHQKHSRSNRQPNEWDDWKARVRAAFPLDAVYGEWLTGKSKKKGWLECRVPWSGSGDRTPSGGVADGTGVAPRGTFHDFISDESISVFDFLIRVDAVVDFASARSHLAELTGIPQPFDKGATGESTAVVKTDVKEQGVDPHRLARRFLERRCQHDGIATLRFWRHEWWRWSGVHYRPLDTEELRAQLTAFVKCEVDEWCARYTPDKPTAKVSKHLIANTTQALMGMVIVSGDTDQPTWLDGVQGSPRCLSMANGLLDLDEAVAEGVTSVFPHTPSLFTSVHLPYEYDPDSTCPQWVAFLSQMLERDLERVRMLQEWFGYCLTPDTSQQRFLMMEGEGSNGKSVVCKVLARVLGVENVSHVPLEMFGQRFQLAGTLGKLANIASEVGELDRADEGVLKAFTAGDRMYFDRKGILGVSALPTARLILATNNRPRFADRSSGLWRRMLLLLMTVCIPDDEQDKGLDDKLAAELSGILNFAIVGLRRLQENGRFTIPKSSAEAIEEYRAEINPARMYLIENTHADPQGKVPCQELYESYKKWCDARGYHPVGERMFGKELLRVYPGARRPRLGSRTDREYNYKGVSVSYVS